MFIYSFIFYLWVNIAPSSVCIVPCSVNASPFTLVFYLPSGFLWWFSHNDPLMGSYILTCLDNWVFPGPQLKDPEKPPLVSCRRRRHPQRRRNTLAQLIRWRRDINAMRLPQDKVSWC